MQYGTKILRKVIQDGSIKKSDGLVRPLYFTAKGVRYRKLEVILTTNMDKLGRAGETVKVAPGYFRNYLMPKLLAVPNIDKFAYLVSEQRKIYEPIEMEEVKVKTETKEDKMKEYLAAATRLDNATLANVLYLLYNHCLELPLSYFSAYCNARFVGFGQALEQSHEMGYGAIVVEKMPRGSLTVALCVFRWYFKVDNELHEPIIKDEIVAEVARQLSVCIEFENLHLPNPLSSLGEYEIPLRLPKAIPLPEGKDYADSQSQN